MPGPGRPLFQAATAAFNPSSAKKVNVTNATRGPLLLISGTENHTVPKVLVKSTLKTHYNSTASTELTIDSGWQELAEYCLEWMKRKGF